MKTFRAAIAAAFLWPMSALAADITVDSASDDLGSQACTLRAAITAANTNLPVDGCGEGAGDGDVIRFAIPGAGPHKIMPKTLLPPITSLVTIDGYTQPGAQQNGVPLEGPPEKSDAIIQVELSGELGPNSASVGLHFATGSEYSAVLGLALTNWGASAGSSNTALRIGSRHVGVFGNFFGLEPSGFDAAPNGGSHIRVMPGATDVQIGLFGEADVNVFGPTASSAVAAEGDWLSIEHNLIGVNRDGVSAGSPEIPVFLFADHVRVTSNRIRSGYATLAALGSRNTIEYNTLMDYGTFGIGFVTGSTGNVARGNTHVTEKGYAIDLTVEADGPTANDPGDGDTGANGLLNHPVLTAAQSSGGEIVVDFVLDNPLPLTGLDDQYSLDLYLVDECHASGRGPVRGAHLVSKHGYAHDATGSYSATYDVGGEPPRFIAATVTGPEGTSEFSACVAIGEDALYADGFEALDAP